MGVDDGTDLRFSCIRDPHVVYNHRITFFLLSHRHWRAVQRTDLYSIFISSGNIAALLPDLYRY